MLCEIIEAREVGDFDRHYNAVATLTLNSQLAIDSAELGGHMGEIRPLSAKKRRWSAPRKVDTAKEFIRLLDTSKNPKHNCWRTAKPSSLGTVKEEAAGIKAYEAGQYIIQGCRLILSDDTYAGFNESAKRVLEILG